MLLSPRFKMSVVEEESPAAAGSTAPAKRMKGAPSSDLHFYKWEEGLIAEVGPEGGCAACVWFCTTLGALFGACDTM